jgi:hypothetical protein
MSRASKKLKRRVRAKYLKAGHQLSGFYRVANSQDPRAPAIHGAICKICKGVISLHPDGTVQNYGLKEHSE